MWKVEYSKRFLKELSKIPGETKARAETIAFDEIPSRDPFELGYVERMKGYPDKYKIRLGDYRIGLTIDKKNGAIVLQRIAHRKDIYRIFP
jgi:mRNA interferase RelE/StbE